MCVILYRKSDVYFRWARGANPRGRTTESGESSLTLRSLLSLRFSPSCSLIPYSLLSGAHLQLCFFSKSRRSRTAVFHFSFFTVLPSLFKSSPQGDTTISHSSFLIQKFCLAFRKKLCYTGITAQLTVEPHIWRLREHKDYSLALNRKLCYNLIGKGKKPIADAERIPLLFVPLRFGTGKCYESK